MKIFYWLHRRWHTNNMEYCRVPNHRDDIFIEEYCHGGAVQGTKKVEEAGIQHVLDGILTIGTLGHLNGQYCQVPLGAAAGDATVQEALSSTLSFLGEEAKRQEDDGRVTVEVTAAPAEQLIPHRRSVVVESFRKEYLSLAEEIDVKSGVVQANDEEEVLLAPLLGEMVQVDRRERVTLADLMATEHLNLAEKATPAAPSKSEVEKAMKTTTKAGAAPTCSTKHNRAFNEKIVAPNKGKEERSTTAAGKQLLKRLRRMLRKKIHPEMARRGGDQCSSDQIGTVGCLHDPTSIIVN